MKEVWQELEEFPNYAVSNMGRVLGIRFEVIKRPSLNNRGMPQVLLTKDRVNYNRAVSGLVASAFLPFEHPTFNSLIHLDGDRTNCEVANLMRRPRWFAVKYQQQFELHEFKFGTPALVCLDTEEEFDTYHEPCTKYGLLYRDIMIRAMNRDPLFPTGQEFRFRNML